MTLKHSTQYRMGAGNRTAPEFAMLEVDLFIFRAPRGLFFFRAQISALALSGIVLGFIPLFLIF